MVWIFSSVALLLASFRHPENTPLALRIALIGNAIVLILDAAQRIRKMKRGDHYGENI